MKARSPLAPPIESTTLATPQESKEFVRRIGSSRLFAKYERSFTAASGLPLTLRPVGTFRLPASGHCKENPFCALLAQTRKGCASCLMAQSSLEEEALNFRSRTHTCFAGLSDTLVPIKLGRKIIAYLQTGQLYLGKQKRFDFDRVQSELILRNIDLDSESAKSAYNQSVSMERESYQGFVKMLEIFAESLAAAANTLHAQKAEKARHPIVQRATKFILRNLSQPISLSEVARAAGVGERRFSTVFKQETSLSFVQFLTRKRIEIAKKQVRESSDRISDIAFSSGFESIAQFNRAFRKHTGVSPSDYRNAANSEL